MLTPVAWRVSYGDPVLDAAAESVSFLQSFGSQFSSARHTFRTRASVGGAALQDAVVARLEGNRELSFHFEGLGGTDSTLEQHHVVHSWRLGTSLDPGRDINRVEVTTVERRALLGLEQHTALHAGASTDAIVRQIAAAAGMAMDEDLVEPAATPPEFRRLVQPSVDDHSFILSHVVPRSVNRRGAGGYRLLTSDGRRLGFCTPGYGAGEAVRLRPAEILAVREVADQLDCVRAGGGSWTTDAFDPLRRVSLAGAASGFPEAVEAGLPMYAGAASAWHPCRTPEAAAVWARAQHDRLCWGYAFSVTVRGASALGESAAPVRPNMRISLAGTKYRERDAHTGLVSSVLHEFRSQNYHLTLHCFRNATTF